MVVFRGCGNQAADPQFDLIRQEGTDHGEDWTEEHWLVDQMDSSDFQWERVLNTHTHTHEQTLTQQAGQPIRGLKQSRTLHNNHQSLELGVDW